MTKQELINEIAAHSANKGGVSKVVIAAVLDTLGDVAQAELQQGGEVPLPGLGKLSVKTRAARTGRNPSTGAEMNIPAKDVPHFSAAKALKEAVALGI